MKFIGGVLASPHIIGGIHTKPVKELIKGYCGYGSKLAFLTKSGITLIGTWNIDEGIQYSNYCYTNYGVKTKVTDYSDYSWKDWKNRYNDKSKEQKYLTAQDKYVCHFCKELKDCKYDAEYMGMLCSECSISLASYTSKED